MSALLILENSGQLVPGVWLVVEQRAVYLLVEVSRAATSTQELRRSGRPGPLDMDARASAAICATPVEGWAGRWEQV